MSTLRTSTLAYCFVFRFQEGPASSLLKHRFSESSAGPLPEHGGRSSLVNAAPDPPAKRESSRHRFWPARSRSEGFDVSLLYYDRAAQVGISGAPRLNIGGGVIHIRAASRAPPHRRPRVQWRALALEKWSRPLCFVCCVRAVVPRSPNEGTPSCIISGTITAGCASE